MSNSNVNQTELSEADKAAIASLTQRVVAAWGQQDAVSFADVFTDDGIMVLPGLYKNGRSAIRDYMVASFNDAYKGTQVTGKPIEIKALGRDAAVLFSLGGVLEKGESEVSDKAAIRAAWIAIRQNGEWRLAGYLNTPRDSLGL